MKDSPEREKGQKMKFMIETGTESHTTSWQNMQAKFADGENNGKFLYQNKPAVVSQEWLANDKHTKLVKTVFELPEGTEILINYQGHEGPEKFIIKLDASQEVKEREIGTSRLRTYKMKGRFVVVHDLIKEQADSLKASQEQGF